MYIYSGGFSQKTRQNASLSKKMIQGSVYIHKDPSFANEKNLISQIV